MLILPPSVRIYMATKPVNMNKSFDGLMSLIEYGMGLDVSPFSGHLFVFRNRRGDKIKLMFWDRGGFWILYKRLEKGTFKLPDAPGASVKVEAGELALLLEGIDLAGSRRRARFVPRVVAEAEAS